jgi:hypothetical protein
MGVYVTARIGTRADIYGRAKVLQPDNCKWVTLIKTINAVGKVLPPCLIFKKQSPSIKLV